ncbi:MAG: hypothetical protein K2W85_02670 [Phycisphaerales bacterium]|nr:hypothetical protein [Phycisphaerales bacterium]
MTLNTQLAGWSFTMNDDRMHNDTDHHAEPNAADRTLDHNLRAIGPTLGLPSRPSAEQLASFRDDAADHAAELRLAGADDGALATQRRRPRSGWLAVGSAMAACVAIGTVLFTMSSASRVEASTILNDLRQRQISGIDLDLNGLGADGALINGTLKVRLKNPVTVDQLGDDQAMDAAGFGAMYAKLAVTTDASVRELPNAQFGIEMAFSPEVGWVYLIGDETTAQRIIDAEPRAAFLASMAKSGLLVNIGALDEDLLKQIGVDGDLEAMMNDAEHDARDHAQDTGASIRLRQQAKIDIKGDLNNLTDEQIAKINKVQDDLDQLSGSKPSPRLKVSVDDKGKRIVKVGVGASDGRAQAKVQVSGATDDESARIRGMENIARTMLSGTARQGELEQLKTILTQANTKATVTNLGRGEYELVADLRDEDLQAGQGGSAQLTVRYIEGEGVQWAELSKIQGVAGSVRFAFANDPIDPALLNSQRLVTVGQTNYIDLRAMMPMIKGAFPRELGHD